MSSTINITKEQVDALSRGESITIEPAKAEVKKWEPKVGDYLIRGDGSVYFASAPRAATRSVSFGSARNSKAQADSAAKIMRAHNRLLAYVDEYSKEGEERDSYVYSEYNTARAFASLRHLARRLGTVYMPLRVAKQLADDINSGVYKL